MAGKLILVGTPIGNLSDFSPRAVDALTSCDFVAAEDTRVTVKLLNHFGLKKSMIIYFEHNRRQQGGLICERILNGETCCLVTDAGMPAISDPGEDLVRLCAENQIEVVAVPGPSAVVTALALSGLPTGRFCFEGFLSTSKTSRKTHLAAIQKEPRTLIFYEAPHKLSATLQDLHEALGDRKIAICRELTKLHEEVIRTTLKEASQKYILESLRGEIVLVIEGAKPEETPQISIQEAAAYARKQIKAGASTTAAAKEAAKLSGHKKGDIYKILVDGLGKQ